MLQDQSRNRTPMPGAQAPDPTPPDTGPARAEAGIAAMLAAPATSDDASESPLPIEPCLAHACLAQVERLKHWDENPDSLTEEEANAEMVRWGLVFRRAVEEPSAGLTDLAAKARLMQDDMRRFLPADRYGTDNYRLLRVILREVVTLAPVEAPAVSLSELPAPGSPEAVAAFAAACRVVDRTMFLDEAERQALKIGSGLQYWTSDAVEAARVGNFIRIAPRDREAAKATPPARLRELLVLTLRRELRLAEAEQATRLSELHALAYPDDQEEVREAEPTDAVALAIEAHRAARAALTAACNPADSVWVEQNGGDASDEAMAPARAIHEAASDAETDAWDALLETRPSAPDGLLRMLRYIAGAGPMEVLGDAREFGRNIAEAAEAALRPLTVSPALLAMIKEWQVLVGAINAGGVSDEEGERIGARLDATQAAIYDFPAASLADLLAKVPVFRDELYDATNGLSEKHEPKDTLAGAAWLGLFRDFERLAGGAARAGTADQTPDPVHALIAEHRAAYAEWDRLSKVWGDCVFGTGEERAADEARKPSGDREIALLKALVASRPTTPAGIAALAEYLPGALRQVDPDDHEPDSEVALRNIAAALRALGGVGLSDVGLAAALLDRRAKAGEFLDLMQRDGFVPYPADAPRCLMAIDLAIPLEAERLLGIAQAEFDRLADAYVNFPPAEREAHLVRMRAEYRLDELAAVIRGGATSFEPSLFDQIIACWREWVAASGPDETDAEREAWERITARRNALLDAAEALPAAPENLPAKALALAWLHYVAEWKDGQARNGYAIDGRLALDIDAAIGGRLRTEA